MRTQLIDRIGEFDLDDWLYTEGIKQEVRDMLGEIGTQRYDIDYIETVNNIPVAYIEMKHSNLPREKLQAAINAQSAMKWTADRVELPYFVVYYNPPSNNNGTWGNFEVYAANNVAKETYPKVRVLDKDEYKNFLLDLRKGN